MNEQQMYSNVQMTSILYKQHDDDFIMYTNVLIYSFIAIYIIIFQLPAEIFHFDQDEK